MERNKAYLCLLAFAMLMGIKCFQPELAESIRGHVAAVIDKDEDYALMIETLGQQYAESGLRRELLVILDTAKRAVLGGGGQESEAADTRETVAPESAEGQSVRRA